MIWYPRQGDEAGLPLHLLSHTNYFDSKNMENSSPRFLRDCSSRLWCDAPCITILCVISLVVRLVNAVFQSTVQDMALLPWSYNKSLGEAMLRMALHPFCHVSWEHFANNFALILLVGPEIEGKRVVIVVWHRRVPHSTLTLQKSIRPLRLPFLSVFAC